jgi:hypothetical protein
VRQSRASSTLQQYTRSHAAARAGRLPVAEWLLRAAAGDRHLQQIEPEVRTGAERYSREEEPLATTWKPWVLWLLQQDGAQNYGAALGPPTAVGRQPASVRSHNCPDA